MARNEQGLKEALQKIPQLKEEFWNNLFIPGNESVQSRIGEGWPCC